jgi:diguanylate cyclase (GGDEF)-like protein
MGGASYILAINLFIAALFALAFLLTAVNNRSDRVAGWFALAYVFGIVYVLSEFLIPLKGDPALVYALNFGAFLGAAVAITIGVVRRYRQDVPWLLLGGVVAVSLVGNWYGYWLDRNSFARMMMYQAPFGLMQVIAAVVVLRSRRRQPVDVGLMILFTLSAAQFISKPFLAMVTGGSGATAAEYMVTSYALLSQSLGAVLQVATGLLMLMILVRDMLVELTANSETDMLSGLYNRRGFELRVLPALATSAQTGVPATLVVADLDAFKQINDSFGHHSGDAVIAAFASLLRTTAPPGAVVARVGGEEFAVLVPGANLAAGRLFAEAARASFGRLLIPELPSHHRCTGSFGVAEYDRKESLADLRRRADTALYAAKRGGRDRVCVAAENDADSMPQHPLAGSSLLHSS